MNHMITFTKNSSIVNPKYHDRPQFANRIFGNEFGKLLVDNEVEFYQLSNKFLIEKDATYFYKYMDLESALVSLKNGNIRFVEPTRWEDKFEGRFYNANYTNVSKNEQKDSPFLYACCMTIKQHNEAAWKVYSYGKIGIGAHCVQFKINRNQFRKELIKSKETSKSTIFEGLVTYTNEDIISNIHKSTYKNSRGETRQNTNYYTFFNNFNRTKYLNLLLLKRDYFKHENEIRFFVIPSIIPQTKGKVFRKNGKDVFGKHIDITIDWANIIDEIRIDSNCTDLEFDLFKDECLKTLYNSNRYKTCNKRERNKLLKKFTPIKTNIYGKRHSVTIE